MSDAGDERQSLSSTLDKGHERIVLEILPTTLRLLDEYGWTRGCQLTELNAARSWAAEELVHHGLAAFARGASDQDALPEEAATELQTIIALLDENAENGDAHVNMKAAKNVAVRLLESMSRAG